MGGAAITHKDEFESIDVENLSLTCKQLSQSMNIPCTVPINMDWSRRDEMPCVPELGILQALLDIFKLVNQVCTREAWKPRWGRLVLLRQEYLPGIRFAEWNAELQVTKLNQQIVRALASEGIPAVGISPFCAGWSTRNRALEQYDVSTLRKTLDCGLIPVLHGDAVFDSAQGCTILSGDVVLRKLAQDLKPLHTVFLEHYEEEMAAYSSSSKGVTDMTSSDDSYRELQEEDEASVSKTGSSRASEEEDINVPGVFDRPPSDTNAILLEEIVVHTNGSWEITRPKILSLKTGVETVTAAHDTTGGMATKIAEAAIIAMSGVDVYIVQVGTRHALEAFNCTSRHSLSKEWVGTIVRAFS
ncbi:hypothetical protein L7F22_060021 [Adiantum nelumboides]|nr:hypothetical protein [Adiantum nelumboides]